MPGILRPIDNIQSKTSRYDRLSAGLTAMVLLCGFVVSCMFLIWLTSVFRFDQPSVTQFIDDNPGEDGNDKPEGFEDDDHQPGVEDFPEIETPQLAEALEAVTNAVSTVQANSEHVSGDAAVQGKGNGYGSREGGTSGSGSGLPDYKRWKIQFEVDDIQLYKKLLDHFEIHIGVVPAEPPNVWRIANVSKQPQIINSNRKKEGKTLRFQHRRPLLRKWDSKIAKDAGVDVERNAILVQFYSPQLRTQIRRIEAEFLAGVDRKISDVRKTNIHVEPSAVGFQFVIKNCEYQ